MIIMIIECKNCSKQFNVSDSDIPKKGRLVQCGNCSTQWFYMPFQTSVEDIDTTKDAYTSPREIIASDGKSYKFLGNQWAELLPSGKTGRLAKKIIARELDKFAGIKKKETTKKKIYNGANTQDKDLIKADIEGIKTDSEGMGIFSMLLVFILFAASVILFLHQH